MSEAVGKRSGGELVGYVEAITSSAALGWVWRPGVRDRLAVELRAGDMTVARAVADGLREDLARSGIGDGRHAFTLPIPEQLRSRIAELRVAVVGEDGETVLLDAPPAPATDADGLNGLQRGLDMLIGSQRVMHRNLQAALLQQPSVGNALAEIAAVQAGLQESVATFELFAIRLEQALAGRETSAARGATPRGLFAVAAVAGLALIGSSWALWRTMVG